MRRLKLSEKMFSMVIGGFICILLIVVWVQFRIDASLRQGKQVLLKSTTEIAFRLLAECEARVRSGELTVEEAQKRAAALIKGLRYGEDGYFWINDLGPRMIMHPTKPEMDGKELADHKDPNGKYLFVEFVKVCRDKGSGYVDYMWPKPGESKPVPKMSFVKLFEPWGWIIGSGLYLDDVEKELSAVRNVFLFAMALIGVLGSVVCWWIVRSATRPLKIAVEELTSIAETIVLASGRLSSSSEQLAGGAAQQAAAIEETASSLEEISSMTGKNAASAADADRLMSQTREIVVRANDTMGQLTVSMDEISKASEQTQKIIKTIDEIAFQTNLLALNAAVEAARAGEAGAGFAVVADEVRNLAMRAAEAARNTADMIEGTVKKIKAGSSLVEKNNGEFSEVADMVKKTSELVGEIAVSSHEQAQGIGHLSKAVQEMDKVVQQNAASADENASVAREIRTKTDPMKLMIADLESLVAGGKRRGAAAGNLRTAAGARPGLRRGGWEPGADHMPKSPRMGGNGRHVPASGKARPEEIIPLEEGDLQSF
jgi:methyl-accepting chemotaxis protein